MIEQWTVCGVCYLLVCVVYANMMSFAQRVFHYFLRCDIKSVKGRALNETCLSRKNGNAETIQRYLDNLKNNTSLKLTDEKNPTAANAGKLIREKYEKPKDKTAQSPIRAAHAEKIYNIMLGK